MFLKVKNRPLVVAIFVLLASQALTAFGQNKVNITSTNPAGFNICAEAEWFEVDVRNITTSTLSGLKAEVVLPTGMEYVKGSISGSGVSESSTANLQRPVFTLPNLSLATSVTFKIKVLATCDMMSFLANGGLPQTRIDVTYPGGYTSNTASPFTIWQPSIKIASVTNQFATVDLGKFITREITISNGGKGKLHALNFRQINENGMVITGYSGGSSTKNGDTIFTTFGKNHFTKVGNGDSFLTQNEYIKIYDTILVKSCTNLRSFYTLNWGCKGKTCATDNASATLTISTKTPKLDFTPKSSTTVCGANSNLHPQELTVKNSGTDTARKLLITIFQGVNTGYYQYEMSRIEDNNITYSINGGTYKKIIPSATLNTYNGGGWSCLGGGAVGSVDLNFPDLPPNGTIHIKWNSISCCTDACNQNFYAHRWKYKASFNNQCGNTINPIEAFGDYGIVQSFTMSEFTPSDVIDKQAIQLFFTVGSASLLTPASNAEMVVQLIIPSGLTHSGAAADVRFEDDNNSSWQPNTVFQRNDTVFAIFRGSPGIYLPRAELKIKLTGDCSSNSKNAEQPYKMNLWYNPNRSCKDACNYLLYCFSSKMRVHCDKSCNAGFAFKEFEAKRISYGKPDNNNDGEPDSSGSLNFAKIKLERVMYGDTLQATFRGKIHRVGSITTWRHLKATSTINYGYYMKVADVRLKIYRSGSLLYNCNGISYTYSTSGYSKTFTFDVGVSALISARCPLYSGFLFGTRDSVELEVKYVYDINPGRPYRQQASLYNEMYLSTVANPSSSQRYQCDTFGGKFVMVGSYYVNYAKGTYSTNSCNEIEVSQSYYLSIGTCCSNYAGGNIFPYEYRSWATLDKTVLLLPKGFEILNARMYQYRTTGTGKIAWQYIDSLKPQYVNGDSLVYDIKSLHKSNGGTLIASDDGFYGFFYFKLKANCAANQGNSFVGYDFHMARKNYFGNGIDTIVSAGHTDVIAYERPSLTLTAEENDIKAKSDTAIWNIRLSNTSYISNAKYVWISHSKNGNTRITEIKNRNTGQVIKPINDVFRLGDLAATGSYELQVKAVFTNCDKDSFRIFSGYDCNGYPDSLAQYPCPALSTWLSYTPVNTRISADLNDTVLNVNLCQKVGYSINISNEGEAKIVDIYLDLSLREGMKLSDTAWGFNPGTNDSFAVIGWTPRGNNIYRASISQFSNVLTKDGLSGFTSGKASTFKFKFYIETNCDFVSSSYFLLRPGGKLNCGKPVISSFSIGKPINIIGVQKPYFASLKMSMASLDVCNFNGAITFKFINLGPDTTGLNDKIQLILPDGLYIDTTYIKSHHNGPKLKPTISTKGIYKAEWPIPLKTVPGDSSFFEVRALVNPSQIPCGFTQILAQSIVKQPALCIKDSTMCNIDVATSSDLILDSIHKSLYTLQFVSAISQPKNNQEQATLSYRVKNVGSVKLSGNLLRVKYVDDVNGNLVHDAGEAVLRIDSIYNAIGKDSSLVISRQLLLDPFQTCRLILIIDSFNCVCDMTMLKVPPIRVINAGRDTSACSLTDVTIGTKSLPGSKYTWTPSIDIAKKDSSSAIFNTANLGSKDSIYRLILTTDKGGCSTRDTALITLYPAMQMKLPAAYNVCRNDSVIVGEIVKGGKGFKSYQWTPSAGLNNPKSLKVWAKPATDTRYSITITDAIGCKLVDSTIVRVKARPKANFTVKDTCAGALFEFKDASTKGNSGFDSVFWDLKTLGTSTSFEPVMFIDSAHTVNVRYSVFDSSGCSHDTSKPVTIFPLPVAKFSFNNTCQNNIASFTNQSNITSGSLTHRWKTDGKTFNSLHLQQAFSKPGFFEIELQATSNRGCSVKLLDTIEIYSKPNIIITGSDVCFGDTSRFAYQPGISDSIAFNIWKLGDGNYSGDSLVQHLFADTGNYQPELVIASGFGCSDTATFTHRVHAIPVASFTAPDQCLNDTTTVRSTATIGSGKISGYQWNTGSGYTNGNSSFKKVYGSSALNQIGHVVISDFGCSDTISGSTFIHNRQRPNLSKTGNCEKENINLNFAPPQKDSLLSARWVINNTDTFYGENQTYSFNTSGNQTVKLTTTHTGNCIYDSVFVVKVDPKPIAAFGISYPCSDNQVLFSNTSGTLTGSLVGYNWDLGDGTTGNSFEPKHIYKSLGQYNVELKVVNNFGCRDTAFDVVDIQNIVVPDFTFKEACEGDSASFIHTSTGLRLPASFSFKLGDGTEKLNLPSFSHVYWQDGNYLVNLSLSTSANCRYDTSKLVTIYPLPLPAFDLDPPNADILNSDVRVIDRSTGASTYKYWLSDGSRYSTQGFIHHFEDSGTYVIRQILVTDKGCVDSFEKEISIGYLINILIPNTFSPNQDNINEVFGPGGLGLINYDLSIFNRWGEMIYHTKNGIPWDGKDALPGSYMYSLKMIDYKGKIHYAYGRILLLE